MPDQIIPIEGGRTVVVSEAAQAMANAAVEYAAAHPEISNALKGSPNKLDQKTAANLRQFEQEMRSNPPKAATVINILPWPLTFMATNRFLRGITIPACQPGQPYNHYHIRGYRRDWEYEEDGSRKFKPILPIRLAAEFVREFSNKDNYSGGVIIYEGDHHPDKIMDKEVEVYDPIGRLITKDSPGVEYDEENSPHPTTIQVPIRKRLSSLIEESRQLRNQVFLERVRKADHDYRLPNGKGAWLITPVHEQMADVLFADGILAEKPVWDLSNKKEMGLAESNCPSCLSDVREGAFKCATCGHVLNAFKAYEAGAIEYGHVSMETMSSDEWEEAEQIKEKREKARLDAAKRRKEGLKKPEAPKAKAGAKADPIRPVGSGESEEES